MIFCFDFALLVDIFPLIRDIPFDGLDLLSRTPHYHMVELEDTDAEAIIMVVVEVVEVGVLITAKVAAQVSNLRHVVRLS